MAYGIVRIPLTRFEKVLAIISSLEMEISDHFFYNFIGDISGRGSSIFLPGSHDKGILGERDEPGNQ